ncbi:MAG: hypothetical protein ABIO71_11555 [Caldimonas sp.]
MKSRLACAAFVAASFAAGCASLADPAASDPARPTREYRIGSNIPVKDPAPAATDAERERAAEAIRGLQRTGSSGKPGG